MNTDVNTEATDVIVIGGGTGGYGTALRAAGLGLKVVLAERDKVGGTCLHRGCIPSKAMLHAAELVDGIAEARERWGVKASLDSVDWSALTATRDDIVGRNHKGVESHLSHAGVTVVRSGARLTGPRSVRTEDGREFTATRGIVLATGSRPRILPGLEPDGRTVVTSDDALFAPVCPGRCWCWAAGRSAWSTPPSTGRWARRSPSSRRPTGSSRWRTWTCRGTSPGG